MKEKAKKNYTKAQLATVIAFAAVILAFFALLVFLPKHAGEMSELEFRTLAAHPIKGVAGDALARQLVRGELSSNVDTFLEDHFPARSFFIALNSYTSRLAGRNAVQSVVAGRQGRLYDAAQSVDYSMVEANLNKLDTFAADNGLDTELIIVPSAAVSVTDELPLIHPVYKDAAVVEYAAEHSSAKVLDVAAIYKEAEAKGEVDSVSKLYYLTDHHWTMEGAYVCYERLCESLGVTPVDKSAFTVDGYEFYGSFYRKAGLWLTKPDTLEVWRCDTLANAKVTIGSGDAAAMHTGVYDESKLVKSNIDKYAAYLYSNNGVTVVENSEGNGEAIMLVKDSFGNSIAPLLAMNYSTVIMVDTRYFTTALPDPSSLVEQYGVKKLVVVFGTDSMVTESWLAYLR